MKGSEIDGDHHLWRETLEPRLIQIQTCFKCACFQTFSYALAWFSQTSRFICQYLCQGVWNLFAHQRLCGAHLVLESGAACCLDSPATPWVSWNLGLAGGKTHAARRVYVVYFLFLIFCQWMEKISADVYHIISFPVIYSSISIILCEIIFHSKLVTLYFDMDLNFFRFLSWTGGLCPFKPDVGKNADTHYVNCFDLAHTPKSYQWN